MFYAFVMVSKVVYGEYLCSEVRNMEHGEVLLFLELIETGSHWIGYQ